AEERGFIDPTQLEAFANELELNDDEREELTRELERTGLEIGAAGAPGAGARPTKAAKGGEKEREGETAAAPASATGGSDCARAIRPPWPSPAPLAARRGPWRTSAATSC